jgi:hypothetical protein
MPCLSVKTRTHSESSETGVPVLAASTQLLWVGELSEEEEEEEG